MKIRIGKTDRCVTLRLEAGGKQVNFYLLNEELDFLVANRGHGCFADGSVMHSRGDTVSFHQYDGDIRGEFGTLWCVKADMNTGKFFSRVKDLSERGMLADGKTMVLDTASFRHAAVAIPQLTYSQILRHPLFDAADKLKEAMRTVGTEQLLKLRGIISGMIAQGKKIVPDFAKASFYFYQAEGKGYNGGIIWHENYGYSTHT